jgi:signal peptidase I
VGRRRRTPWRENLEAAAGAILLAVMFKYFVLEFYRIPSGSMQPTLYGAGAPLDLYDRVVADKLSFHFRDPERFEVVIFRYPLDRSKNFVKRVVGLPGELLRIEGGDVWVRGGADQPWRIPRRPAGVMGSHWRRVGAGDSTPGADWALVPGADGPPPGWRVEDDRISARDDGAARFRAHGGGPIVDEYADGYPPAVAERLPRPRITSRNPVGDLRLAARVEALPGCEWVAFSLYEGGREHRFTLPGPAAPADAVPRLESVPRPGLRDADPPRSAPPREAWRLEAGRAVEVEVENLDDLLTLRLDGETVATLEVEPLAHPSDSGARVEVRGEGAELADLRLYRDVYYEPGRFGGPWEIPAGHYFMLGDNTQDSSDSRDWVLGTLAWGTPGERPEQASGNLRPSSAFAGPQPDDNPVSVPGEDEDGLTFFRDVWGERHAFRSALQRPLPPDEAARPAPFVPRELIAGRAIASLWPIAPSLGVWRPKWVR